MSAMRSASSITRMPTCVEVELAALEQVDHAARRRDRDLDACAAGCAPACRSRCRRRTRRRACRSALPSGASTSTTCLASSRVGTSTSAVGWPGIALARRSGASGRPNASVLPEPVRGLAAHVAAGERVGDGGLLDGEGLVDALGREGVDELGPQAEISEGRHSVVSSNVGRGRPILGSSVSYFGTNEVRPRDPKEGNPKHQSTQLVEPFRGRDGPLRTRAYRLAHGVRDATDARRRLAHHGAGRLARTAISPPSTAGAVPGVWSDGRRVEHATAFDVDRVRRVARTIPSTAPRTSRRSCCARTSSRPVRSSKTTAPRALDLLGFASQLVFDTFTSPHVLRFDRDGDHELAVEVAAAQHRAMLDWCSVDPAAAAGVASSRSATCRPRSRSRARRSTAARAALRIGQYCPPGHSPSHVELEPLWATCRRSGRAGRAARRRRGCQRDDARLLRERPAAGARLPRRRHQLQVDRLPVDPAAGDADAQRADHRRRAACAIPTCASA